MRIGRVCRPAAELFSRRQFSSSSKIFPRIDYRHVAENAAGVQTNAARRNCEVDVQHVVDLHSKLKAMEKEVQQLQAKRNAIAKSIKSADKDGRTALVEEGKALKAKVGQNQADLELLEEELHVQASRIPNATHPSVPDGEAQELASVNSQEECTYFKEGFEPLDHTTLGAKHSLFDFEAGAAVAGSRFYYTKNEAALLELALVNYTVQSLVRKGFTPILPPDLTHPDYLEGTGFQPKGGDHQQSYAVSPGELRLIGTSEVPIAGMYRDKILAGKELPVKLVAFSHCYRNEAGGHGAATKGVYRVHQFSKVELFSLAAPEQSEQLFEELVQAQTELFSDLGLHFKVLNMPANDLGYPAERKVDMEAWMPKHAGGSYGEISSASNCTDYQSRRLNIRFKREAGGKSEFVHTLNATGCAVPRMMLAILEQHQQADGTIAIPKPLQPYLGGATSIPFLPDRR